MTRTPENNLELEIGFGELDGDPIESAVEEEIADLLSEALPVDWQDPLAIERRRDYLEATAYWAAECATRMLATAELSAKARRAAAGVYVESLLGLDKAWREFVGKTRQSAGEIVFAAAAYWAGEEVATTVEGNLELLHRLRYEDYVAAQRGFGRR